MNSPQLLARARRLLNLKNYIHGKSASTPKIKQYASNLHSTYSRHLPTYSLNIKQFENTKVDFSTSSRYYVEEIEPTTLLTTTNSVSNTNTKDEEVFNREGLATSGDYNTSQESVDESQDNAHQGDTAQDNIHRGDVSQDLAHHHHDTALDEAQAVALLKQALTDEDLMRLVLKDERLMEIVAADEKMQRRVEEKKRKPSPDEAPSSPDHIVPPPAGHVFLSIEEILQLLERNFAIDVFHLPVADSAIPVQYVDHLIIVTGRSTRHMKAMAHVVKLAFKQAVTAAGGDTKLVTALIEGEDCTDWMAVDVGNAIVHFMLEETRTYYDLESLWQLGPEADPQYQAMLADDEWRVEPLPAPPTADYAQHGMAAPHFSAMKKRRGGAAGYQSPKVTTTTTTETTSETS